MIPQFHTIKTTDGYEKFMHETRASARHTADEFMRFGKSKWIVRALQEGWSSVLRNLIYQLAVKDVLTHGNLPTIERLNGLIIDREDHEKLKNTYDRRSA